MISRTHRFHGYNALRYIYQKGKVVRSSFISLKYTPNARRTDYRLAVVVSRKVSKSAVVRNRIRRRFYELVRERADTFTGVYDLVFIVYDERLATLPAQEVSDIVEQLLTKAELITKPAKTVPNTPAEHDIVKGKELRK